jgi:hypothetical protein
MFAHLGYGDTARAIHAFVQQGKVLLATMQHVNVPAGSALEGPLDESDRSSANRLEVIQAYVAAGYAGLLRPGPPPRIAGDTEWGHTAHALHIGYLKAFLQVAQRAV